MLTPGGANGVFRELAECATFHVGGHCYLAPPRGNIGVFGHILNNLKYISRKVPTAEIGAA
jgi:hypothetical protein